MPKRLFSLAYFFALIALVLLSLWPLQLPAGLNGLGWDKLAHFLFYFGLLLLGNSVWRQKRNNLYFSFALGLLLECLQDLSPYRQFDYGDLVANTLGALAGYYLLRKYFMFQ
ncbi:VanZ family protein [Saprospira sp. CCB-QB6]|uniref:VanZ family protein n=1 Tax=Saprospira sp. CCB-QB6 TaxID=3023936 RepID=UPI00234B2624|nr:VanZ family protein [Saprospira sp. CCB-QB6]WCL80556.1 VanZ family protein [Saprospira sp. CCB-QB6]